MPIQFTRLDGGSVLYAEQINALQAGIEDLDARLTQVATSIPTPAPVSATPFLAPRGHADEEAINALLDATGCVILGPGTFTVSQPIVISGTKGCFLAGCGKATTLQCAPDFPAHRGVIEVGYGDGDKAPYTANVTIQHLTLDGNGHAGTDVSGLLGGAYRLRVVGVEAYNFSGYGMRFDSPNKDNRTDLMLSGYYIGYCHAGGLFLGGPATDSHVMHGIVMHSGRSGGQKVVDGSHGIVVQAASQQITDFQSYGNTGASVFFNGLSSNTKITNGKIETSDGGGLVAPEGLWMVNVTGTGFRKCGGRAQFDVSGNNMTTFSVAGCTFDQNGADVQQAIYVDVPQNSTGTITGGVIAGFGDQKVTIKGEDIQIVNLGGYTP